jgi:demethylmenaquinone methyltransferase/2-methoxy-6-polyprenyl-1,4-benzoquinol methylase
VDYCAVQPGQRVLDLACGTGDVTWMLAERGAEVIGSDINADMMALANRKGERDLPFVLADAGDLPFPDGYFDLVTCSFAGRGFPDWPRVLGEVHRVLKPGGVFWNLDFARPPLAPWDFAYRAWLTVSGAALGLALHGDARTYIYIPASMKAYPGQRWLDQRMREAGFQTQLIETRAWLIAFNQGTKQS